MTVRARSRSSGGSVARVCATCVLCASTARRATAPSCRCFSTSSSCRSSAAMISRVARDLRPQRGFAHGGGDDVRCEREVGAVELEAAVIDLRLQPFEFAPVAAEDVQRVRHVDRRVVQIEDPRRRQNCPMSDRPPGTSRASPRHWRQRPGRAARPSWRRSFPSPAAASPRAAASVGLSPMASRIRRSSASERNSVHHCSAMVPPGTNRCAAPPNPVHRPFRVAAAFRCSASSAGAAVPGNRDRRRNSQASSRKIRLAPRCVSYSRIGFLVDYGLSAGPTASQLGREPGN